MYRSAVSDSLFESPFVASSASTAALTWRSARSGSGWASLMTTHLYVLNPEKLALLSKL